MLHYNNCQITNVNFHIIEGYMILLFKKEYFIRRMSLTIEYDILTL